MTRVTVSLGEHDAARLTARAQSEGRSVSQMARVLIERGLGASEGEAAAAAAASPAKPIETLHSPGDYALDERAGATGLSPDDDAPDASHDRSSEDAPSVTSAGAAVTAGAADSPAPAAREPIPKSLEQVLGDPKTRPKPKGAVSARQAQLAEEARLRAQSRADMFSLVCPNREQHQSGVRCPQCKGIQ